MPRESDNLGLNILGGGYDVPDRVRRVADPRYDDPGDSGAVSVTVTLH